MDTTSGPADSPYREGTEILVYKHDPANKPNRPGDYREETCFFQSESKNDAIMKFARWPLSHIGQEPAHKLTIKRLLQDKHRHDAQLAVCSLATATGQVTLSHVVAKIYDPLYYMYDSPTAYPVDHNSTRRSDPTTRRASGGYCGERKTYNYLQQPKLREITAGYVPDYHGSWITAMPAPQTSNPAVYPDQRAVCLILMEYLPGASLFDLTYNPDLGVSDRSLHQANHKYQRYAYPDDWLTYATRQWLEAETRMYQIQISNADFYLQNIMIVPSPVKAMEDLARRRDAGEAIPKGKEGDGLIGGLPQPRIVVFDFASTSLDNISYMEDLPGNPIESYWVDPWPGSSGEKLAPRWWYDDKKRQEWLKKEFGGKNAKNYLPVDESKLK